ncbi:hypothetical protein [Vallitalea okinawensis]|uniref:hypothetical protein n=1 Tax=Vallitalea okinawensis TaxID=2078660 RepID=UPI000CFBA1B6|nr:hypothetical protein [Vallitalea okinawensis]
MINSDVNQVNNSIPVYAVKTQMPSIITTGNRAISDLSNVLSAAAENLGQYLSYRVILGDQTQADNLTIETIEDEEIVPVEFTNGYIQLDDVNVNTSTPIFITFNVEDTYAFVIELIDTDTGNVLDTVIKTAFVITLSNSTS